MFYSLRMIFLDSVVSLLLFLIYLFGFFGLPRKIFNFARNDNSLSGFFGKP
ncbi:hypothetical protein HFN_0280 [Helicobacter fennelliae MRY12-0050]|uniref:Uncharacterized protein n=1 Tax=Helicobacter fennelliae MRY12-0050 TaxID=1325130 RepID=T1CQX4_9HELI|nr:hypothetical protein HFN_0280 [Helicobacter fennelliae MRY12-0050]